MPLANRNPTNNEDYISLDTIMSHGDQTVVASIVHSQHGLADGLLADFAYQLRRCGWHVHGVVQDNTVSNNINAPARQMTLVDINDGSRFPISQNIGSASCCIDPSGVAAAGVVLRHGLAKCADLVVVNRFGELEANGGGFAAEMLELMSGGVPLLTVVAEKYLKEWRDFTGNAAVELPTQREALEEWFLNLPQTLTSTLL